MSTHRFESMAAFLRDFETEVILPVKALNNDDKPLVIAIEAAGGGTPGKAYVGRWSFIVFWDDREVMKAADLETGTPMTHIQAAAILAGYLAAYGDPDSGYDGDNMPTGEALRMCQENHDRLSLWADEIDYV